MTIGMGKQAPDWTLQLLALKDRSQASVTALPHGLHLGGVFYPEYYKIPNHAIFQKLPKDARRFN